MAPSSQLLCPSCTQHLATLFLLLLLLSAPCIFASAPSRLGRRLAALVPPTPLILPYHRGPLLTGPSPINVYLLWYGSFTPAQKATVVDFLSSFLPTAAAAEPLPSVASWWKTLGGYTDLSHAAVSSYLQLTGQSSNAVYSLGKRLKKADIALLVERAVSGGTFPADSKGIFLVLTAEDVYVEGFCMNTCGFHDHSAPSFATKKQRLLYAWVGNSAQQCPGLCAWPYALPTFGPQTPPLISPNKDVGIDGMVINIATLLAGTATNPFDTGYFQGDAAAPLEAATACTGIFGNGAYPGYPGSLLTDKTTGASYNAHGINKRMFLLPALWRPSTLSCATLS